MADTIKAEPKIWYAYFSDYRKPEAGYIQHVMQSGIAGDTCEIYMVEHSQYIGVQQELERVKKNYQDLLERQQRIVQSNTLYHEAYEILVDGPDDSDQAMAIDKIRQANKLRREVLGIPELSDRELLKVLEET